MTVPEGAEMLTVEEAAQLIGIQPGSVRTAIADGRLPAIRFGKRVLMINRADAERYRDTPKDRGGRPPKRSDDQQQ